MPDRGRTDRPRTGLGYYGVIVSPLLADGHERLRRNSELAANLRCGLMVSNVSMALSIIDVSKVTP